MAKNVSQDNRKTKENCAFKMDLKQALILLLPLLQKRGNVSFGEHECCTFYVLCLSTTLNYLHVKTETVSLF